MGIRRERPERSARRVWVRLHRGLGLATAVFLFVAGLSGAVIAWDRPLDAALNPAFYRASTTGPALSAFEIARRVEAADPRIQVTYLPLEAAPGATLQMRVAPRVDLATGRPYVLGFDELAADPATGIVQARRQWGAFSLSRLNLIPFVYKLHYTLHLPRVAGFDAGTWLMGSVALMWFLDGLVALGLSFPSLKSWRKSFAFRIGRGGYALTFDLHRSGGVWLWALLVVVACTSVSMNLGKTVVRPLVAWFSPLAPVPLERAEFRIEAGTQRAPLAREQVVAQALRDARARGVTAPVGAVYRVPGKDACAVGFFAPGNARGDTGLGNAWLYYNASTGRLVDTVIPGRGSAGDIFLQAQFPLHSGRIFGTAGRIAITLLGLAIATLSATGVMIWARKRAARRR